MRKLSLLKDNYEPRILYAQHLLNELEDYSCAYIDCKDCPMKMDKDLGDSGCLLSIILRGFNDD